MEFGHHEFTEAMSSLFCSGDLFILRNRHNCLLDLLTGLTPGSPSLDTAHFFGPGSSSDASWRLELCPDGFYYQPRRLPHHWFSCLYHSVRELSFDRYCSLIRLCTSSVILRFSPSFLPPSPVFATRCWKCEDGNMHAAHGRISQRIDEYSALPSSAIGDASDTAAVPFLHLLFKTFLF